MVGKYIVEIVVCELDVNDNERRWKADGRMVAEFHSREGADLFAGELELRAKSVHNPPPKKQKRPYELLIDSPVGACYLPPDPR